MRAGITDRGAMAALSPNALAGYLRGQGWTTLHAEEPFAVFHQVVRGEVVEVDLPVRQTAGDYARRVAELLANLEIVEGRSQREIYQDILHASHDVVRFVLDVPDAGRIGLDEASTVFGATRDLLLAAACSANSPRSYFPRRKPARAMEFMRKVRVAAPEPGSFVVVLESPVPAALSSTSLFPGIEDEPFERTAISALARATARVRDAISEASVTGSVDRFAADVEAGVNANLCDALARLIGDDDGRNLVVAFTWAASRPPPISAPNRVGFARGDAGVLRAAARFLKERMPLIGYEVAGQVVKLESPAPTGGGDIVIAGAVDDAIRQVRVSLGPDDYHLAIRAHQEERTVSIEGELVREGRSYRLRNPSLFSVLG